MLWGQKAFADPSIESGLEAVAGCTASAIISQYQVVSSPNGTDKFEIGELAIRYSRATPPGPNEKILVNPDPAVKVPKLVCWPNPKTRSLELLVEIAAEGVLLKPLAVPGREVFGSKGVLKLAPDMPKTITSLYSPPY